VTRDHTFHPVRVTRVVDETADARSFVLDVPNGLRTAFTYDAGQFCTFRVVVDGQPHFRCYSMSSAPALDADLQVTVKRVPNGAVSNWMIDHIAPGDTVDVASPAGVFRLAPGDGDIVAFAAGSGITPVFSLLKTALTCTSRRVQLLYANRDRDAVIFGSELDELAAAHGERFAIVHHLDVEHGFVDADSIRSVTATLRDPEFYVCGPAPFMEIIEQTLLIDGARPERIHIERFTPDETVTVPPPDSTPADGTRVTIELDGRTEVTEHRAGTTILQTARQVGMSPPFSCESGNCATCMARVVEGSVSMHVNNALTPEEVDEGWVLTCQSVPTTPTVHVVYGFD
jgi:ferredoxin-NADP reductase